MTQPPIPMFLPVSTILPREARDMLIASSKVEGTQQRLAAIDAAIDYIKLRFPSYFQPQPL